MTHRLVLFMLMSLTVAQPAWSQGKATATSPAKKAVPEYASRGPIDIRSDRLEAHNKEQKIVFYGNVQARQGDVLIFADKLTTFYDKAGKEIERIIAKGNVKITQDDKVGTSDEAVFENRSRRILLLGDPHLWQGKDELRGERITVYLEDDRVMVEQARGVFSPNRVQNEGEIEK